MLRLSDYFYELPEELIARYPAPERGLSKLLYLDRSTGKATIYPKFTEIINLLQKGDVLVYNSTKVSKRRVYLQTEIGRFYECLFLEEKEEKWICLLRNSRKLKLGTVLYTVDKFFTFTIWSKTEGKVFLKPNYPLDESFFEKYGTIPIPPYLKRQAEKIDEERYQTIFASKSGSVAAPTAGLHFSQELTENLKQKGIVFCEVCLEVGYGTFAPLELKQIQEKKLHKEKFYIPAQTANLLNQAKGQTRIIAIGTTTLRALESCLDLKKNFQFGEFTTELFIQPGDVIYSIDGLITNFHLPESSLLMLVCAFAGRENVLNAYKLAVQEKMRFFSYGDAMLII